MTAQPQQSLRSSFPDSFAQIRELIGHLPESKNIPDGLTDTEDQSGLLPKFIQLTQHRARWGLDSRMNHVRLALFYSNYASVPNDPATTQAMDDLQQGRHGLNRLCALYQPDIRLYELNPAQPAVAMDEREAVGLMAYGMMAVEPGVDCIALAGVASGTQAVAESQNLSVMRLEDLAQGGAREVLAIAGALLAARLAKIPVIADGVAALLAAAALADIKADAAGYILLSTPVYAQTPVLQPLKDLGLPSLLPATLVAEQGLSLPLALQMLRQSLVFNDPVAEQGV